MIPADPGRAAAPPPGMASPRLGCRPPGFGAPDHARGRGHPASPARRRLGVHGRREVGLHRRACSPVRAQGLPYRHRHAPTEVGAPARRDHPSLHPGHWTRHVGLSPARPRDRVLLPLTCPSPRGPRRDRPALRPSDRR